ncbi:MAG TPA: hypothetical protein DC049_08065, partial [Spirochaetia bacterium]|nr:hypothetical protein [Spirochaetia bacterium]
MKTFKILAITALLALSVWPFFNPDLRQNVDEQSGELRVRFSERIFTYSGMDIFSRMYSVGTFTGSFGAGFASLLDMKVLKRGSVYYLKDANGFITEFKEINGKLVSRFRGNLFLTKESNNSYKVRDFATKRIYSFNTAGSISAIYNLDLKRPVVIMADGVKFPNGQIMRFVKNELGLVTQITDFSGRIYSYSYNENLCLTNAQAIDGYHEMYTYDSLGRLCGISFGKESPEHISVEYTGESRDLSQIKRISGPGAIERIFTYQETTGS